MTVSYKFPAAKEAAHELVQEAREVWMEVGQSISQQKVESQAASCGYALQVGIGKDRIGHQSARIYALTHSTKWGDDPWFLRFFEYGTVHIPAMPFIRPGARKANKAFLGIMGTQLEGKIRRKQWTKKTVGR
jgi:hypothetical protein